MAKTDPEGSQVSDSGAGSILICDAGPLIHLDELSQTDLLADFRRVFVPAAVWDEVGRHRPQALGNPRVAFEKIKVESGASPQLTALGSSLTLHTGEREVLSLALSLAPEGIVLTDDTAARLAAISLRLRVHGTVGILLRAVRRKQLTIEEALVCLESIPTRSTLFIRSSLLAEVIELVKASA